MKTVWCRVSETNTRYEHLLNAREGQAIPLLGNEAIARGALEAGINVATTYPGTPSVEIGDALRYCARTAPIYFEYSVNEKVALDVAAAAAMVGLRSIVFMKHVGLNVASDSLMSLAYTGVRGALVIVTADDPGCQSSQNEQDNRSYARFAGIPLLEPSDPQEALEMTREAFALSSTLELPILLRTTTRVSHALSPVIVGRREISETKGVFEHDPHRFVLVPKHAKEGHASLLSRMRMADSISQSSKFNFVVDLSSPYGPGYITSGPAFRDIMSLSAELHGRVLKLGMSYPPPRETIAKFLAKVPMAIVVEELEPLIEQDVRAIAQEFDLNTRIEGKTDNLFPRSGQLSPDIIRASLANLGLIVERKCPNREERLKLPARPPILCAGCGHRAVAFAVKQAARHADVVFPTDIGCYSLMADEPWEEGDVLLSMGASIGVASGLSIATNQKIVAFIGDSTFFHNGIPALINAVHNGHSFVLCILDNGTTAMTGRQPTPATATEGKISVDLEALVKACGVRRVFVLDAYRVNEMIQTLKDCLIHEGISVIIACHPCRLLQDAETAVKHYVVDQEKCTACDFCVNGLGCPALDVGGDGKVAIDPELCVGCGLCEQICPPKAILEVGGELQ